MTCTFTCRGCGDTLEVYAEEGFEQQPIHGRCVDCWDDFQGKDLEEQFEEAIQSWPSSRKGGSMTKGKQGFASMDPEKQRAIASKGGRRAHEIGKGHEWTPEEAVAAGRKGGKASRRGVSLVVSAFLIAFLGISGCRSVTKGQIRNSPQYWCERNHRPSPRQIYECFKLFQEQEEAEKEKGRK